METDTYDNLQGGKVYYVHLIVLCSDSWLERLPEYYSIYKMDLVNSTTEERYNLIDNLIKTQGQIFTTNWLR